MVLMGIADDEMGEPMAMSEELDTFIILALLTVDSLGSPSLSRRLLGGLRRTT